MSSTFFGIEMGRRALATNQLALDVVGQNTSNINTPGYSRQVVNFSATEPYTSPDLSTLLVRQIGTGVTVDSINRIRDEFIDRRVYDANSTQGAADSLRQTTGQVEAAYNEPSTSGIGSLMTKLFNSFSDLSANPESGAIRSTVLNNAQAVGAAFKSVDNALQQLKPQLAAKINTKIGDVNTLAQQIAALNKQIRLSVVSGDHPNDLQDKQGALLNQLSSLVDISISKTTGPTGNLTGEVQVNVGGYTLVQNDVVNALPTQTSAANNSYGLVNADGTTIPITGGEIFGLIKGTDLVNSYRGDLNTLATNFVSQVNGVHQIGYGLDGVTGRSFFANTQPNGLPIDASYVTLDASITGSLNAIAAASPIIPTPIPPAPPFATGNGDNARNLAALAHTQIASLGNFSLNEYYSSKVAQVGTDSQSFITQSDNQQKVVTLLKNQQSSISGVSLDEELTNMLQYQRSYQAASRIVTVMDDTLDRIINGMGAGH